MLGGLGTKHRIIDLQLGPRKGKFSSGVSRNERSTGSYGLSCLRVDQVR